MHVDCSLVSHVFCGGELSVCDLHYMAVANVEVVATALDG